MNLFFRSVCQLGIFMICAQAIVHFRPNGSYEKYLKMLVSVMILVQVFLPVTRLFSAGTQQGLEENIAQFETRIQESMNQAVKTAAESDELLSNMSLEEVRNRMESAQQAEEENNEATKQPEGESHDMQVRPEEVDNEALSQAAKEENSKEAGQDSTDSGNVAPVDIGKIKVKAGGDE